LIIARRLKEAGQKENSMAIPSTPGKAVKSISDVLGISEFHSDFFRVDFKTIIDGTFRLDDAKILSGFRTEYGEKDAVLMKLTQDDGNSFTTISSSSVVVDRVRAALVKRALPVNVTPRKQVSETSGNEYFLIE
jgi:hypothetical protein